MNIDFDLHIHTFRSPCGWEEMLPADIVRLASERGITRLGITDHFYTFTNPKDIVYTRREIEKALAEIEHPMQVFIGCEAEIMAPGHTAGSAELAERLDFVMVGATHFQNKGITDLPPGDDDFIGHYYLRMFEYAVSLPWVDVVAHPFFVVPGICSVEVLNVIKDSELLPAIELAKENNVAMEISRRALTPGQLDFSIRFYKMCKTVGLQFTAGSDAHCLQDVANVQLLIPIFNTLGLKERDFWTPRATAMLRNA